MPDDPHEQMTEQEHAPRWAITVVEPGPGGKPKDLLVIASSEGVLLMPPPGHGVCIVPATSNPKLREALREASQFNERRSRRTGESS